ncbi:TetR/AcrR family transcriptional regulator [Microbacterium natoriense]|uniref:TetR/AcrR family transcriptional regulator n=1 Tax=Microbacterium natoriense TaxID=284570 RepID=A0AAW8ET65_9MICO|nr:TetR family transcriptional regulator [Microbacterium natoriense]MDQ0646506.1 TetR/AcrR family transcriptional regulator [Microbacterium natoriense]
MPSTSGETAPSKTRRPRPADRELTFAERARREQLISVTIDLIADNGAARTSLQNIADAASITKAAVLYHYPTKKDVIRAAYEVVRTGLIAHMRARIEAAPTPGAALKAYLTSQLDYLAEHPQHVRVMAESFTDPDTGITEHADTQARWRPLADLITKAQTAGEYNAQVNAEAHAIMFGGAVDALVAETLTNPDFSLPGGASALLGLVDVFMPSPPEREHSDDAHQANAAGPAKTGREPLKVTSEGNA